MVVDVEFREHKIDSLRETNIELFYKNHALGLGVLNFFLAIMYFLGTRKYEEKLRNEL